MPGRLRCARTLDPATSALASVLSLESLSPSKTTSTPTPWLMIAIGRTGARFPTSISQRIRRAILNYAHHSAPLAGWREQSTCRTLGRRDVAMCGLRRAARGIGLRLLLV